MEETIEQGLDGLIEMLEAFANGDDHDRELISTVNHGK
jgi:hypothetical protein